jgi:hypothetical protein
MHVTKVDGPFTDEILAKNFLATAKRFQEISSWIQHVDDLALEALHRPLEVVVKAPKRSKLLPLVTAVGVGYVCYQIGQFVSDVRQGQVPSRPSPFKSSEENAKKTENTKPGHYEGVVLKNTNENSESPDA